MAQLADAWLRRQHRRWLRPDAHRWLRPNARRFLYRQKAYNPDQPRWPAGSGEDSGRWRGEDGATTTPTRLAQTDRPPPPGLGLRFALDIAVSLMRAYRAENNLRDLFGREGGSTVAFTTINGERVFGVNSDILEYSSAYTVEDDAAARQLRDTMLAKYPDVMNLENIGQYPNDALFHAEVTVLLRAARQNGETLEGESLVVFVDKAMCENCKTVLPFVGLELGNPTVTFVDRRGIIRTMRDGSWK